MPDSPQAGQQWPGHAVLQVPVPALEGFVRRRTAYHDASFLGTSRVPGEAFVHAHVTALGPFDELPDAAAVAAALAGAACSTYRLERVEVFPNGIIHAVPAPAEGFWALTARLRTAFPEVLPYRGEFAVAPHVTLDALGPGISLAGTRAAVATLLPATCRADAVDLVWYQQGCTELLHRWPLGRQ